MPTQTPAPFIFFSKEKSTTSSGYFDGPISCRLGSPQDRRVAHELSGVLLALTSYPEFSDDVIGAKLYMEDMESIINAEKGYVKGNKTLIISLEKIDGAGVISPERFIYISLLRIHTLIKLGYTIGINFSQILFLADGERPPTHFRLNIDQPVSELSIYQAKTELLSYKFARLFFSLFSPELTKKPSQESMLCMRNQIINSAQFYDLSLPVKTYYYFRSKMEFDLFYQSGPLHSHKKILTDYLVVPIETPIFAEELLEKMYDINFLIASLREVILIFKGEQYNDPDARKRLLTDLLRFIKVQQETKDSFNTLIQIILLTNPNSDQSLIDLAPAIGTPNNGDYIALSNGAGFYLNASEINKVLYRKSCNTKPSYRFDLSVAESSSCALGTTADYVIQTEVSPGYRKSKGYSTGQLRNETTLSYTHQVTQGQSIVIGEHAVGEAVVEEAVVEEAVVEEAVVEETVVEETVVEEDSTAQPIKAVEYRISRFVFLEGLAEEIKRLARDALEETAQKEQLFKDIGYTTKYYRDHFTKYHILKELTDDPYAAMDMAANILGQAAHKAGKKPIYFPLLKHSYHRYVVSMIPETFQRLEDFFDGMNPKDLFILHKEIFGDDVLGVRKNIDSIRRTHQYYFDYLPYLPFRHCSILALQSNTATHAYVDHYIYEILLSKEQLSGLDDIPKQRLIQCVNALLGLFKPHPELSQPEIKALEEHFKELILFYFPGNDRYIALIDKLFLCFEEHNEDNLRILVNVLISGHTAMADNLLKLVAILDARALLPQFYKVCFKYAFDSYSLYMQLIPFKAKHKYNQFCSRRLDYIHPGSFWTLAIETPTVNSVHQWPVYNKFCHGFLLYITKHRLGLLEENVAENIHYLWTSLQSKFLSYTGNELDIANEMMARLVKNLIKEDDGLSIAPLRTFNALRTGLLGIIEHAILHHTLDEQIDLLDGASFLYTDVPYALNNNFKIVCPEMRLKASSIDVNTRNYAESYAELKSKLDNLGEGIDIKTNIFRYLGAQNLRKKIKFYRALNKQFMFESRENSLLAYMQNLMFGYFVLTTTGDQFNTHFDIRKFETEFCQFLKTHRCFKRKYNTSKAPVPEFIGSCLTTLDATIHEFPDAELQGQTNLLTLVGGAFKAKSSSIPDIFTRYFATQNIMSFLHEQHASIRSHLTFLTAPELPSRLVKTYITASQSISNKRECFHMVTSVYNDLNIETLLTDSPKIALLLERYNAIIERCPYDDISSLFNRIFKELRSFDLVLDVLDIFDEGTSTQSIDDDHQGRCITFLKALVPDIQLLKTNSNIKPLLILILQHYLTTQNRDISALLTLCKKLISLEKTIAFETLNTLLKTMKNDEGYHLFVSHPDLTVQQYQSIVIWLQKLTVKPESLAFLHRCIIEPGCNINSVFEYFKEMPTEECLERINLCHAIHGTSDSPIMEQLKLVDALSPEIVHDLLHLLKFYEISHEQLWFIMHSSNIGQAIDSVYAELFARAPERYLYDELSLREKVSNIELKSCTELPDQTIDEETQLGFIRDYKKIMSYMMTKPILTLEDGNSFTVNQLNAKQFKDLFDALKKRIIEGDNKHEHQLMLLALCSEALYRTTGHFPRHTQLLCVLNTITEGKKSIIHEIQTGEGKSIVAALHAAILYAEGRTVDLVTENVQLARDSLYKFKHFYGYLNIPYAKGIIVPNSPHHCYKKDGINYSTVSGLSLFRIQMQLDEKPLPDNSSLVGDEIDAALTTTVKSIFAAPLDPLFRETPLWSPIYKIIIDFVQEKDIFLGNRCSQEEDIINLTQYFATKKPNETLSDFFKKIPIDLRSRLIDSALIALQLRENIDYVVVHKKKETWFSYAAPIVRSTNRPDPNLSYGYVQPFIHTILKRKYPSPKYPFEFEPISQTVVEVSAINFFDHYRYCRGHIIGFTGTAGTAIELDEFSKDGLIAYKYPSFHPNRAENRGIFTAHGEKAHFEKISVWIKEHKVTSSDQPILIITSSPEVTHKLRTYLEAHIRESRFQSFIGHDDTGDTEESIVDKAGTTNTITVANQSLTRGADVKTRHPDGIVVINACKDIKASERRQIEGRTARNGGKGLFISIIDMNVAAHEDIASVWAAHQKIMSIEQQKIRLKTRLVEEALYHLIINYFFKLKKEANSILKQQFGTDATLVYMDNLFLDLSKFNEYAKAIGSTLISDFHASLLLEYHRIIDAWFAGERFQQFSAIEPPVPLDGLKGLRMLGDLNIKALLLLSEHLAAGSKAVGKQNLATILLRLNDVDTIFTPYFSDTYGLQQALGQALTRFYPRAKDRLCEEIVKIQPIIIQVIQSLKDIPVIGSLISIKSTQTYCDTYLKNLIEHIQNDRWDSISLPNLSDFNGWLDRISNMVTSDLFMYLTVPFLVKKLKSHLKATFKPPKDASAEERNKIESFMSFVSYAIDLLKSDAINLFKQLMGLIRKPSELTFGKILDIITPILNNEVIYDLVSKGFELAGLSSEYLPLLDEIPSLLRALELHRSKTLKELLKTETFLSLIMEFSKSEPLKMVLDKTEFKMVIPWIRALPPELITSLKRLSLLEFIRLCKVLAHPRFNIFLNTLPSTMTYGEMSCLLETEVQSLTPNIRRIVTELKDYQSRHEAIARQTTATFLGLKDKYQLTVDKLQGELAALRSQEPTTVEIIAETGLTEAEVGEEEDTPGATTPSLETAPLITDTVVEVADTTTTTTHPGVPTPVVATPSNPKQKIPWLLYMAYGTLLTGIIAYNVFLFSIPILVVSLLLVAVMAYLFIKQRSARNFQPLQYRNEHSHAISESHIRPEVAPEERAEVANGIDLERGDSNQRRSSRPSQVGIGLNVVGLFAQRAVRGNIDQHVIEIPDQDGITVGASSP